MFSKFVKFYFETVEVLGVERIVETFETIEKVRKIGIALTVLADELATLVAALERRPAVRLVRFEEPLKIPNCPSPIIGGEPPEEGE